MRLQRTSDSAPTTCSLVISNQVLLSATHTAKTAENIPHRSVRDQKQIHINQFRGITLTGIFDQGKLMLFIVYGLYN